MRGWFVTGSTITPSMVVRSGTTLELRTMGCSTTLAGAVASGGVTDACAVAERASRARPDRSVDQGSPPTFGVDPTNAAVNEGRDATTEPVTAPAAPDDEEV